jgi:hypothetical protein
MGFEPLQKGKGTGTKRERLPKAAGEPARSSHRFESKSPPENVFFSPAARPEAVFLGRKALEPRSDYMEISSGFPKLTPSSLD